MKFYLSSLFFFFSLIIHFGVGNAADPLPDTENNLPYEENITTPNPWNHPIDYMEHGENENANFQSKFFNMLLILGVMIGFMFIASWALKRMMKTKLSSLNTSSSIKVLETRYLSPRATIYLVEVQNKTYLLAESPTTVTYLQSFPSSDKIPAV